MTNPPLFKQACRVIVKSDFAIWDNILSRLESMSMSDRKKLTLVCRALTVPLKGTALYAMTLNSTNFCYHEIESIIIDPLRSSLLQMMIRAAPLSQEDIKLCYEESLAKEIDAANRERCKTELDFSCFFGSPDIPLHRDIPSNPRMAIHVQRCIDSWISKITKESYVLYPKLSSKSMSRDTLELYNCELENLGKPPVSSVSKRDLEELYMDWNIKIGGVNELKQVWYTSQLTPRSYYTTGGSSYHASKYMSIMEQLADELSPSARRYCTSPERLKCPDDHYVFIYDLQSFTSRLDCHEDFLFQLQRYTEGKYVSVYDSQLGYITVELSELIKNYRETCYNYPEFEVNINDKSYRYYHAAGQLGEYGNISSARFIHAAVLLQTVKIPANLNVAGDDAIIITKDHTKQVAAANQLGLISEEKTFLSTTGPMVHLKRQITIESTSYLKRAKRVNWPCLEYLCTSDDIDPRYPRLHKNIDGNIAEAASSLVNFRKSLTYLDLSEQDGDLIYAFSKFYYWLSYLPIHGVYPSFIKNKSNYGLVPALSKNFNMDPIQELIDNKFQGYAKMPVRGDVPFSFELLTSDLSFTCNSHPLLNHLVEMKKISKRVITEELEGEEAYYSVKRAKGNKDKSVFHFTC